MSSVRNVRKRPYLISGFVRFLQPDPPLVIQLDAHATAAVGPLADPTKELLQVPPQRGVLLPLLGVARPRQQPLCKTTSV